MSVALADINGALEFLASLVLEGGRRWGEAASVWQWQDARLILSLDTAVRNHFLTRPRGGSKTTDLAGICLAVMLYQAPAAARTYALAVDRDQGRLLIDSMSGFARRTPGVAPLLEISNFRVTVKGTDVTLDVLAADAASAWGLRPYFLIIDEFAQWPDTSEARQLFEAMRTATGKLNSRLVILTTAGDPAHFSNRVREHARIDPLWHLHEVPGPLPWISRQWLEEQQRALPEAVYNRLHLNQWSEQEERLATLDDLRACVTHTGALGPRPPTNYVIGLDIGITNDCTAAAVCHAEPLAREAEAREGSSWSIVVDLIQVWEGSRSTPVLVRDVQEWVLQCARLYLHAKVVADPWQAMGLTQELRHQGLNVIEFNFSAPSNGRLANTLHLLIRNRTLALPDDPELIEELSQVRLRETSTNVMRLEHDPNQHNDRAIAIAMAATVILERPPNSGPRFRSLRDW
jgi:phage terminase large subunit-like protein